MIEEDYFKHLWFLIWGALSWSVIHAFTDVSFIQFCIGYPIGFYGIDIIIWVIDTLRR